MELQVDGKKVFAATGGKPFDASLPVVIFVHCAGMDHTVWALQTRWFAWHGRSVLAVDLPGHGKSDGPALQSIGEICSWLIRLIEATGAVNAALARGRLAESVERECRRLAGFRGQTGDVVVTMEGRSDG